MSDINGRMCNTAQGAEAKHVRLNKELTLLEKKSEHCAILLRSLEKPRKTLWKRLTKKKELHLLI